MGDGRREGVGAGDRCVWRGGGVKEGVEGRATGKGEVGSKGEV